ncbi:hypothetical protein MRB53_028371 [Persea americana]|uniref:Uncharacterized protein n=1 Tax=Persea americana TaxID=3435 RepID=A0ACC2KFA1_PERAE|nr:hypothetical protein MRB53_028371 [Persea americana]
MAASLTITFDENKYQVMLQEKQSKRTFKCPASCRSVTSLGNSQNTEPTSTPRTVVFGSLGPFPLPVEKTARAKKQKTAPQNVAAPDTKGSRQETRGSWQSHKASTYEKPGLPQDLVPAIFTKTKKIPDICKASIPGSSQGEPVLSSLTSNGRNLPSTEQPKQPSTSRLVHTSPKSSRTSQGLDKNLLGPALLQLNTSSQQGPSLKNLKLRCDRLRTASKSCPRQSSRKTSSAAAHEGPRPSLPEHGWS